MFFFAGTFLVMVPQPIRRPCLFPHSLHCASLSPLTSTSKMLRNVVFWFTSSKHGLSCSDVTTTEAAVNILHNIFAV